MKRERALEIIAAYGADAGRWPDGERAAVLALAAADAGVAAAIAEARAIDGLIGDWARDVRPGDFDTRAIVMAPQVGVAMMPVARRWLAGGALAATLALGLVFAGGRDPVSERMAAAPVVAAKDVTVSTVPSATADGGAGDAAIFATVFTPTVDEDELI